MEQISLAQAEDKALSLEDQKKPWHFHILSPKCRFNQGSELAFILEDTNAKRLFVSYDNQANVLAKKLVGLVHGKDILSKDKTAKPAPAIVPILDKAKAHNDKAKPWHHHKLNPDCLLNSTQAKWVITFEDEVGEADEVEFDTDPNDDLGFLEVLYYDQPSVRK